MTTDCIFCKIARGEIGSDIVYQDDDMVAFRDIHPQAPTHVLVVPRKHIARLADVTESDLPLMGRLIAAAKAVAGQEGIREGFRLVINSGAPAGQAVFHIHAHVLGGRVMDWPPG